MLLNMAADYAKYLEQSKTDDEMFHYIGGATKSEMRTLAGMDEDNITISGKHLIDNYEELTE